MGKPLLDIEIVSWQRWAWRGKRPAAADIAALILALVPIGFALGWVAGRLGE